MSGKLGRFQMRPFTSWKGCTKENALQAMGYLSPQQLTNTWIKLLSSYRGANIETFLKTLPVKEMDNDTQYYWNVIGSDKKNVPLKYAINEKGLQVKASDTNVGINGAPFYLVFAEDYFFKGEVLFGELNEVYQLRIIEEPKESGSNTIYKVTLYGHNATKGIPANRLLAGERFSAEYAPVGNEFSRGVGGIRFASPTTLSNEWTTVRIKHKVPGNRLTQKLAVGIPVIKDGKSMTVNKWIFVEDMKLEEQFSDYKNNAIMFGTSTRHDDGTYTDEDFGGSYIKAGSGLREQLEAGNIYYYNNFSLKFMVEAISALCNDGGIPLNQRTVIVKTGLGGATAFHEAVTRDGSGWTGFVLDNSSVHAVSRVKSDLHQNALSAGFQFTEFLAPNGVHVKISVDPCYDDRVRNKMLMPNSQLPAESYRYDIMEIGTPSEPNVQLVKVKGDQEVRSIVSGIRNPWDNSFNVSNAATDEDGATIHKMAKFGVVVLDPTRTMSFIPAILQA